MTDEARRRGPGDDAMSIAPIKSTRIYQEIVRQVKAMIAEGRLKSGDQLPPERDLAEKFVVSRTSVREALRALESLGLKASVGFAGTSKGDPCRPHPPSPSSWRSCAKAVLWTRSGWTPISRRLRVRRIPA